MAIRRQRVDARRPGSTSTAIRSFSFALARVTRKAPPAPSSSQVRSVVSPTENVAGFEEMVAETQGKYYMLGGKGGVGKASCAASLAVKFASSSHPTFVVSTDPAHSLSDSFARLGELKLGELLDTPPSGLDEAIAISMVMQFVAAEEYKMFNRMVFDTAPTGHTLRLLSLPDSSGKSMEKIMTVLRSFLIIHATFLALETTLYQ